MILKTKEFKDVADKILLAIKVDKTAANLELLAKGNTLRLSITNKEFYCAVMYQLEAEEDFHATVDADKFLSLVSKLTTETFKIEIKDTSIVISSNKSSYKIPMIYTDGGKIMSITPITILNKTVEMDIKKDILDSILNVNSKEIQKVKGLKNVDVKDIQELYYIDETGCFTFTTGACLNAFELEKPVKMLLNERIVKLFRLFKEDVHFSLGQDQIGNGLLKTKISLETATVYLAAIITNDDLLLSKVQGPCAATKRFISETYPHHLVLSVQELKDAISRLLLFIDDPTNTAFVPMTVRFDIDSLQIINGKHGSESITVEDGSFVDEDYEMAINIIDLKTVLDSCKEEHITVNCGNHKSVVISRGLISNLIPEAKRN